MLKGYWDPFITVRFNFKLTSKVEPGDYDGIQFGRHGSDQTTSIHADWMNEEKCVGQWCRFSTTTSTPKAGWYYCYHNREYYCHVCFRFEEPTYNVIDFKLNNFQYEVHTDYALEETLVEVI